MLHGVTQKKTWTSIGASGILNLKLDLENEFFCITLQSSPVQAILVDVSFPPKPHYFTLLYWETGGFLNSLKARLDHFLKLV